MRTGVLVRSALMVVVVVAAVFATSVLAHRELSIHDVGVGDQGIRETETWPCCNDCGICTKSDPPQCECLDLKQWGCHPSCKKCERSLLLIYPPLYQCKDIIVNYCKKPCTTVEPLGLN